MDRRQRIDRRTLLNLGVLASLGTLAGCGEERREIPGGFVDDRLPVGHFLRDGAPSFRDVGTERVPVVVVGGGVAGLAAAWRLNRGGLRDEIRVLELGGAPGGTARGGRLAGMDHPWGAHYLPVPMTSQRALCALLEDLGVVRGVLADGRIVVDPAQLVRAPSERLWYGGGWQEGLWPPVGEDTVDARSRDRLEGEFDRLFEGAPRPFTLPVAGCGPAHRELDQISAGAWLASLGTSGPAFRWWAEYATRDDFGAALDEVSAWAFVHYHLARRSPETGESGEYLTWPDGNAHLVRGLIAQARVEPRTRRLVTAIRPGSPVEIDVLSLDEGTKQTLLADQAVVAAPQFVVRRLLAEDPAAASRARFQYGSWLVANLHLDRQPGFLGFGPAWDNVTFGSPSLGFVDATHQVDRAARDVVWTWYLPLVGPGHEVRRRLLETPFETWREMILRDLRPGHPDIDRHVQRIELWRWGHAMVKPVPGFLFGSDRAAAARPFGNIHFAHADLGGLPLFEEALWAGCRAAEEVLSSRGIATESLL